MPLRHDSNMAKTTKTVATTNANSPIRIRLNHCFIDAKCYGGVGVENGASRSQTPAAFKSYRPRGGGELPTGPMKPRVTEVVKRKRAAVRRLLSLRFAVVADNDTTGTGSSHSTIANGVSAFISVATLSVAMLRFTTLPDFVEVPLSALPSTTADQSPLTASANVTPADSKCEPQRGIFSFSMPENVPSPARNESAP